MTPSSVGFPPAMLVTMNDTLARELANLALPVLKRVGATNTNKNIEANFQPTEKYSDSHVMASRGGFFGAKPTDPFTWLAIAITLRPGVMGDKWVGYTIDIKDPETPNPKIVAMRIWPEYGGEEDVSADEIVALKPHIAELMATPLTSDNKAAPREAPESMF